MQAALRECARAYPEAIAARLEREALLDGADEPRDDIAILLPRAGAAVPLRPDPPEAGFGMSARAVTDRLSLRVALEPDAAGAARHALGGLPALGRDPDACEQAALVVSELITNVLMHSGLPHTAPIELIAIDRGDVVRVELHDASDGFDPDLVRRDPDTIGGWGLILVEQLTDRWGVDVLPGDTCCWFELDQRPCPAGAAS